MKEQMINSLSNIVFCALKEAEHRSGIKKNTVSLEFFRYGFEGEDKKLFGILKVKNLSGKNEIKIGMFLQAFIFLLEKNGIKSFLEEKKDCFEIHIYKPSKIERFNFEKSFRLTVNGEKTSVKCIHRPKKVYKHKITVRFRDLDAMGHVSNNVFLVYLEEARVGFRNHLARGKDRSLEFFSVVASHYIEYLAPIFLGEELIVEIFISHLTEKSYRFDYRIINKETGEVKANAYTQMVGYDYKSQKVREIDAEFMNLAADYTV